MRRFRSLAAIAAVFTTTSIYAQANPAPPANPQPSAPATVLHAGTSLVILDVAVQDKNGQPVHGLKPENFRAPFTTAEGWGTYNQTIQNKKLTASLDLKYGALKLSTVSLTSPNTHPKVKATLNGQTIQATIAHADGRHTITFAQPITIPANQRLTLELS